MVSAAERVAALMHGSWESRLAAADSLAASGAALDPRVVEALLSLLGSLARRTPGQGALLRRAVDLLARAGERGAMPGILALLAPDPHDLDDDPALIDSVCRALAKLDTRDALPSLRAALVDEDYELHERAIANALAELGGSAEQEQLLDALRIERDDLQKAALGALRLVGDAASTPALVALAERADGDRRIEARLTLAAIDEAHANVAADVVAEATGFSAQAEILRVMASSRGDRLVRALLPALFDPGWARAHIEAAELLVDRGVAEAQTWADRAARDAAATPWQRARAASIALKKRFDDDLFQKVLDTLLETPDANIESRSLVRDAAEGAIASLVEVVANRPDDVEDLEQTLAEVAKGTGAGADASVARSADHALAALRRVR